MMPIVVKSDDVRSGRKAKTRHGRLGLAWSQWVKVVHDFSFLGLEMGEGAMAFVIIFSSKTLDLL